jgi:hypothetical protein
VNLSKAVIDQYVAAAHHIEKSLRHEVVPYIGEPEAGGDAHSAAHGDQHGCLLKTQPVAPFQSPARYAVFVAVCRVIGIVFDTVSHKIEQGYGFLSIGFHPLGQLTGFLFNNG